MSEFQLSANRLFVNKSTGKWNGSFQNKSSFELRMSLGTYNLEYSIDLRHIFLILNSTFSHKLSEEQLHCLLGLYTLYAACK